MALSDWNEKQLLGLTAGIVGAIVLVMGGLDAWVYLKYDALRKDIDVNGQEAQRLEKKAKTIETVQREHGEMAAEARRYEKRVPKDLSLTDLIDQISNQARAAKLRLTKAEREREAPGLRRGAATGGQKPTKLELRIEGGYDSLGKFVSYLESHQKMERFLKVTGFTISAYKEGLIPGADNLGITLNLVTYTHGTTAPAR